MPAQTLICGLKRTIATSKMSSPWKAKLRRKLPIHSRQNCRPPRRTRWQALTLAAELAQSHVGLGLFHDCGVREYEQAVKEFQRAIELQPNNSLAVSFIAFLHRRQGKWDLTLDELKKSIELEPRHPYTIG